MGERGFLLYFPFTIHPVKGDSEATIYHHHSPERDRSLGHEPVEAEADIGEAEAGQAGDGSRCLRAGW